MTPARRATWLSRTLVSLTNSERIRTLNLPYKSTGRTSEESGHGIRKLVEGRKI
jgi:hypothetical protein